MRTSLAVFLLLGLPFAAQAETLAIKPADTTQTVLAAQKGKRVTLRLRSGQELTGMLREQSERLVVLESLAGRELFDALIPVDAIEAIIVRGKP
ncbi:MAG: hypothetical protein JNJ60_22235 [Rhodocyclaceae bacterium]|nr:hypothetical protein [Rhodocyclaceae bacterium]